MDCLDVSPTHPHTIPRASGVAYSGGMKQLVLIFFLCGVLLPSAYGETISKTFANGSKDVGEVKNGMPYGQAK